MKCWCGREANSLGILKDSGKIRRTYECPVHKYRTDDKGRIVSYRVLVEK